MFAAAIDAVERLFVEQTDHVIFPGDLLHDFHCELIIVRGDVRSSEHTGKFMLTRSCFIVFGFCHDAELPEFFVQLFHKRGYTWFESAEIVIGQFLTFGRKRTEQCAAGINKIFPTIVNTSVDQEIFLLRTDSCANGADTAVAEQLHDPKTLPVNGFHGTEQRGFHIQSFPAVGAEGSRNAENIIFQKSIRSGIPSGITAGFKSCTQPAGGEAGGIRFTLNQFFTGKLQNNPVFTCRRDKAVMLFGSNACQRLKPV